MTLIEFLKARLAEEPPSDDVEVRRRILVRCETWKRDSRSRDPHALALGIAADLITRELVAPYVRHPDCHVDWRPAPLMA